MSVTSNNGNIIWSEENKRWENLDGTRLQGLTTCDFIDYACCGHGNDEDAYISLKDGRRFVLDKMNW